jgi:hypothetical protein
MADEIGGVSIAPKMISAMIATVRSPRFRCLAVSSVISPFLCRRLAITPHYQFFGFFLVFFRFSACRYQTVIKPFLALFGLSGLFPSFTSLLCLPCRAFVPVSLSSRVAFLSRGAVSVSGVSVSCPRACPCVWRLRRLGLSVSVAVWLSRFLALSGL